MLTGNKLVVEKGDRYTWTKDDFSRDGIVKREREQALTVEAPRGVWTRKS